MLQAVNQMTKGMGHVRTSSTQAASPHGRSDRGHDSGGIAVAASR